MALKVYRYKNGIFQFDDKHVPKGAEPYKPKAKPSPKGAAKTKAPASAEKVTEDQTK